MIAATAFAACSHSANPATITRAHSGRGSNFTVISVIAPSMPSDPVMSASRSKPALSSASLPISSISPAIVATRKRRMLWTVSPYLRQCTPPAFSATLPPMLHAIWLEGSGA